MAQELYIATNNGDIGGGEVMLLNIARAARSLGYRVTVIGPAHPPLKDSPVWCFPPVPVPST